MRKGVKERYQQIKLFCFDLDGVLFSGRSMIMPDRDIWIDAKCIKIPGGEILKERSLIDGQGISFLRTICHNIAFVTAESDSFVAPILSKLNSLPSVLNGLWTPIIVSAGPIGDGKLNFVDKHRELLGLSWSECAYMGDDIGDYAVMKKIRQEGGCLFAPANAEREIRKLAHFISKRKGGNGAIRDVANEIINVLKVDKFGLPLR